LPETALDYQAIAIAEPSMTGRAVNVKSALPSLDVCLGDGEGELVDIFAAELARVPRFVDPQITAGNGSLHRGPSGTVIGEEIGFRERLVAGLIVHVVAAAQQGQQQRSGREEYAISQLQPPLRD
jgi:hypothetical protein